MLGISFIEGWLISAQITVATFTFLLLRFKIAFNTCYLLVLYLSLIHGTLEQIQLILSIQFQAFFAWKSKFATEQLELLDLLKLGLFEQCEHLIEVLGILECIKTF